MEHPDIADELSVLVIDQHDSPLGISDVNVVFGIHRDASRLSQSVILIAQNAERTLTLRVKNVYSPQVRITDDDALHRVRGHLMRRSHHPGWPIGEGHYCIANTSQVGGWLRDFSDMGGASKSSTALREGTSIHQGATVCGATSPPRTEVDCELEASDSRVRVNFDDFLYFALAQKVPRYSSSRPPPRLTRANARTFCVGGSRRNGADRSIADETVSSCA
jgi:hypothetical protein